MKKTLIVFVLLIFAAIILGTKKPIPLEKLKAKYTDEYSHFISFGELDVHYKDKGEGVPIVLIHGTSSSLHTWEPWENILSKDYRTISIDMQGGGLTTPPSDHDYSIEAYIGLIDAVVESLELDSFYLAGNSLGGHTAWEYAANSKYANKVIKLVLVDPSGFFVEGRAKPAVFNLAKSDFLLKIIENLNTKPFVKKSLKEVYYNDELVTKELVNRYADLGSRAGNRAAFFYKVRGIETGSTDDLAKIACPTLIQWGENDEWIPLELADIFTTHIPNSKLIVYPECGHVPMEELPEQSAADVLEFIGN